MDWRFAGKAWVFGDDVPNDEGLMPLRMVRLQEYRPEVLATACFEQVDPAFAPGAQPRDLVIAGKNFGFGNPHIQGFLALKGLGVAVIVESMSRGPMRACVNAGVPVMVVPGAAGLASTGDPVEADFESGTLRNTKTGASLQGEPMPEVMREVVGAGGGIEHMKKRLAVSA